jgi:hypothetical protein
MQSDPSTNTSNGKPLGLLAERLVMFYTGQPEETFELGFNLAMSDPILNC